MIDWFGKNIGFHINTYLTLQTRWHGINVAFILEVSSIVGNIEMNSASSTNAILAKT